MASDGTISGTPSADGTFVVSVKATNSIGALVTRSAPAITTTSLPTALTGTTYSYQLTATGVPAPTFAVTGLPAGLSINASTGVISGTPTAGGTYSSINITVTNTVSSASKTLTMVVNAIPVITTTSLDSGVVGVAYSDSVAGYGYPTTVTFSATGLPAGLSLNSSTGVISGAPTAAGNYVVAVTATNTAGSSTQNLGLIVKQKTSISTTTLPAGKTGTAYSATVAAGGVPAPTFAATGLPAGLSINSSTGVISGTPTAAGTYSSVVVTATNSVDATSKTLTIQINDAPIFTTTSLAGGVVGTAYSSDINASGTPAPTFSATGLPAGLSINSTSGTITGTPTTAGSYTVSVTATNAAASTVKSFGIVVNQIPAITTTSLATGKVGTAYSSDINATGTPAPTYSISAGALPGGLSLNASTGTIAGTPTASGSFSITVKATNSVGNDTQAYTMVMNATPSITTTSLAAGKVGTAYSSDVNASGYPAPTFSASGLPAGLSINSTSGTITGTPTASGAFTPSITATNAAGTDTNSFALTVTLIPSISNTTIPDGKVGTAYSLDINSTGYPSPTFSATGLPGGLSINTTSGLISGTPTGAGGSYSITVKATNSAGSDTLSDTSVIFASVPVISTGSIAGFSDAQNSYTTDINSSGYPAPTYSATGLPSGLSINSTSGTITGTPTEGSYTITVKAANSAGSDTQAYSATVAPYKQSAHTNPGEWVNRQDLDYAPIKTTSVDYDGADGSIKLDTAPATSSGSTHGQAGLRVDGLRANTYYTMTCYVQSTTTSIYHYTMGTTDTNDTGDNTLDTTDSGVWHKISHRWLEGDVGSTIAIGGWNKSTTSEHEWEIDGCTIVRS
jgi:hypothetical protein